VYRAVDTRLGRSVAIKTSREKFNERFQREARAISAVNHPNICALYDVGPDYLVMELVDGETLAARLRRGPLSIDQVLKYGAQLADALAAAHRKGITHRDLKPGNIMVANIGVKMLDFGLAKLAQDETVTVTNAVMGTPAYMAPEQRAGKGCDARSDIYALGLVLYEMATRKRLLDDRGNASFASGFNPRVIHVVERCLSVDPENRWQSAGDVKLELEWAATPTAPTEPQSARRRIWMAAGVASIIALAILTAILWKRPAPVARETVKFTFEPPLGTVLLRQGVEPAISPDGRRIAFAARDASGLSAIWLRSLEAEDARRIAGTDGATSPFWSPDSQFVGFFAQGKLKKIAIAGGPSQNICSTPPGLGASWSISGDIVFNPSNRAPLMRVSSAGGSPQQITKLDLARQENSHRWPNFLPDGHHFLFTARSSMKENTAVYAASLDSEDVKRVLTEQSNASYIPSGYILFGRDGSLLAQRFDAGRLATSGDPFPIAGGLDQETASAEAFFSVSADASVLTYVEASQPVDQLTWFGRDGSKLGVVGPPSRYTQPRISPDGKRLAVVSPDPESGNRDIWLVDLENESRTRFTSNPANDWWPVWSPDGTSIAFASDRTPKSSVYRKAVNGSGEEELLIAPPPTAGGVFSTDWSRDGRLLAFHMDKGGARLGLEIWILPLFGDRKPWRFSVTEFSEDYPRFSPDGKWVAYSSAESGSPEIYVRPFDGPGKYRVSQNGGSEPTWRRDGKELFFVAPGGTLMAAEIKLAAPFSVAVPNVLGRPCPIAGANPLFPEYAVTADGRRFLLSCESQGTTKRSITVSVDWRSAVKWPDAKGWKP